MRKFVLQAIGESRAVTADDCVRENFDFECASSLYSQILLRMTKRDGWKIDKEIIATKILPRLNLRKRNESYETLLDIAHEMKASSYRLAKMTLEISTGKSVEMKDFMENPFIVDDPMLRRDILECIAEDPLNSTDCFLKNELSGKEFEDLLINQLDSKGLCYETEEVSRMRGKPKTPDILFLIPMAVLPSVKPETSINGKPKASSTKRDCKTAEPVIVNWIDSKAMFADEDTFREHLEQLNGYYNRYGTGMVIYWHGFVDTLLQREDSIVLISDHFPQEWIYPTGEMADGKPTEFDRMFNTPHI